MILRRHRRPSDPNSPDQLLLDAALGVDPPRSWEAWLETVDLDEANAASVSLLPHVYEQLVESGYDGSEMGRLRGICRRDWVTSRLLLEAMGRLFEQLSPSEADPVALGDLALGRWSAADHSRLPMRNAQVLVPTGSVMDVLDTAQSLGWQLVNDNYPDLDRQRVKGLRLPEGLVVSVRWFWADRHQYTGPNDALWPRAIGGWHIAPRVRTASATDQLLATLTDEAGRRELRWIPDVVHLVKSPAAVIDWSRLVEHAGRLGLRLVVHERLASLLRVSPGLVPPHVMHSLRAASRPEQIEHWFIRHSGPSYPWRSLPVSWSRFRYGERQAGRRPRLTTFQSVVLRNRRTSPFRRTAWSRRGQAR